eukprot:TRINITY_DN17777_c0_g1_i1.p1 TRINITY_DN17777_c0_g1~~TRINITY_DN17777_c0_g1_i1.p1  ORF type:complete len:548 (-),score=93.29 TRINITY_DN17777_c0_g1_i1:131-1726(-)
MAAEIPLSMTHRVPSRSASAGRSWSDSYLQDRVGLDPLLNDQLSSMGIEVSTLLLKTGAYEEQLSRSRSQSPEQSSSPQRPRPPRSTEPFPPLPRRMPPSLAYAADLDRFRPDKFQDPMFCPRCTVMKIQVRALAQSLAGLAARTFNWSASLSKLQRRDLAEIIGHYCKPCSFLDASLEDLCIELEHIQWSDVSAKPTVLGQQHLPPAEWATRRLAAAEAFESSRARQEQQQAAAVQSSFWNERRTPSPVRSASRTAAVPAAAPSPVCSAPRAAAVPAAAVVPAVPQLRNDIGPLREVEYRSYDEIMARYRGGLAQPREVSPMPLPAWTVPTEEALRRHHAQGGAAGGLTSRLASPPPPRRAGGEPITAGATPPAQLPDKPSPTDGLHHSMGSRPANSPPLPPPLGAASRAASPTELGIAALHQGSPAQKANALGHPANEQPQGYLRTPESLRAASAREKELVTATSAFPENHRIHERRENDQLPGSRLISGSDRIPDRRNSPIRRRSQSGRVPERDIGPQSEKQQDKIKT